MRRPLILLACGVLLLAGIAWLRVPMSAARGEPSPPSEPPPIAGRDLAARHCARCHALPEPAQLPREAWPDVLRWMGNYVGVRDDAPDVLRLVQPELVPPQPELTQEAYARLAGWYVASAPAGPALAASVPRAPARPLDRFEPVVPPAAAQPAGLVTLARIDPAGGVSSGRGHRHG